MFDAIKNLYTIAVLSVFSLNINFAKGNETFSEPAAFEIAEKIFPYPSFSNFGDFGIWAIQPENSASPEIDSSNIVPSPRPETSPNSEDTPSSPFFFTSFSDYNLRVLQQSNSTPSEIDSTNIAPHQQQSISTMLDIVYPSSTKSIPSPKTTSSELEPDDSNKVSPPHPETSTMSEIVYQSNTDSIPSPNPTSSEPKPDGSNKTSSSQSSISTRSEIVYQPNIDGISSPKTASSEPEPDDSNKVSSPQPETSTMSEIVYPFNTASMPSPNPTSSEPKLDSGNKTSTPQAEASDVSEVIFPNIQETREEENALTFDMPPKKRSRRSQPKRLIPSETELKNLNKELAHANSRVIKTLKGKTIEDGEIKASLAAEGFVTEDCDSETLLVKYGFFILNVGKSKIEAASQDFLKQLWRGIYAQRMVTITDAISSEDLALVLEVLSKQIPLNFLKLLRLGDKEPTEIIIKITNALIYNQTLQKLDLSNCRIHNDAKKPKQEISLLSRVISTSCLKELVLQDNRIEYLNEIAKALKTSNTLKTLNLSNNNIRGAGARTLSNALIGCKLSTLILSFNYIGNSGVKALVEALKKTSELKILDLSGSENEIEDLSKIEVLNDASIFLTVDSKCYCVTKDGVEETRKIRRNPTKPTVDF